MIQKPTLILLYQVLFYFLNQRVAMFIELSAFNFKEKLRSL